MRQLLDIKQTSAFAPATSANLAVGFDILGFAINDLGDKVTLTKREDNELKITTINGHKDSEFLPIDIKKNTASVTLMKMCQTLDIKTGFDIEINKGIPLGSGLGGSASSSVAAAVALNGFFAEPLENKHIIDFALYGEEAATGCRHGDNIIPCVLGGLQLSLSVDPVKTIELPIPQLFCVLTHPHIVIETKTARAAINKQIELDKVIKQTGNLAGFISGLYTNNLDLLTEHIQDEIAEPARSKLIPNFDNVKELALNNGALSVSISGAGPTLLALTKDKLTAEKVSKAMQLGFANASLDSDSWVSTINEQGAYLLK